ADFKLKTGQILSEKELEELISASNFGKLYSRTLEYVFSRPHSVKEVRSHLKKKQHARQLQAKKYKEYMERLKTDLDFRAKVHEMQTREREKTRKRKMRGPSFTVDADGGYTFQDNDGPSYAYNNENEYGAKRASLYPTKPAAPISNQDIEKVMNRLMERGYLDDLNFARYFVENRNTAKGISTKRLRIELLKKGVDEHIIEQVLAENPRDQSEEIRKAIEKKRRWNYDDKKLMQYLLRQGFDYELVRNLVLSETD
ncbi:MAG: regulatory protein RecX, partial [Candidatus Saccharibacteria bacterium]|nr:regulatory protein RecX [Candidatus Saccharibacteria bacterium]